MKKKLEATEMDFWTGELANRTNYRILEIMEFTDTVVDEINVQELKQY